MSTLDNLGELKKKLDVVVIGKENILNDAPSVIICNHNRLKDIFYLPFAFDEEIISLVSARLVYKQDNNRLKYVNKYLNAFPIEAHGGKCYSDACLSNASNFLNNNLSVCIWPEGAYINDTKHVYKGRTGAARILFNALLNGCYGYLLPVSINIKSNDELDEYVPNKKDKVLININEPIQPDEYFYSFTHCCSVDERNDILHNITDDGMKTIAKSLNREYIDTYIELYPKGNVIFSDGHVVDTIEAQNKRFVKKYDDDLKMISKKLVYNIQKR